MKSNNETDLEDGIDTALSAYSSVEPSGYLEARILKRIYKRIPWIAALPAIAAVLLIGVFLQPDNIPPPAPFRASLPAPPPPTEIKIARHRPKKHPRARLTEEERSLLKLAELYPLEAHEAFTQLRDQADSELEIEPIEVTPLSTEGN